ncbi:hypothetical protein RRG08_004444 [Elysia crispata]|uniref:Uncharacterized protein n=1 Tax=Elysia crispata TaxID=231223 RepID=A0AAE1E6T2_9GAST|nr:hypothetical protein RRG08_004444 [Elysia crispata]
MEEGRIEDGRGLEMEIVGEDGGGSCGEDGDFMTTERQTGERRESGAVEDGDSLEADRKRRESRAVEDGDWLEM